MNISSISTGLTGLSSIDFSGATQAAAALTEESAQMESLGGDEALGQTVDASA